MSISIVWCVKLSTLSLQKKLKQSMILNMSETNNGSLLYQCHTTNHSDNNSLAGTK
jgi:hypothetical protein